MPKQEKGSTMMLDTVEEVIEESPRKETSENLISTEKRETQKSLAEVYAINIESSLSQIREIINQSTDKKKLNDKELGRAAILLFDVEDSLKKILPRKIEELERIEEILSQISTQIYAIEVEGPEKLSIAFKKTGVSELLTSIIEKSSFVDLDALQKGLDSTKEEEPKSDEQIAEEEARQKALYEKAANLDQESSIAAEKKAASKAIKEKTRRIAK